MEEIKLDDIHPIDDPLNLPIKTISLGRANIFVRGEVDPKHIGALADVAAGNGPPAPPIIRIKLSVWEDSGAAKSLDCQLLIGGVSPEDSRRSLFVFEPYEVRFWAVGEDLLPSLTDINGVFWQVARFYGHNRLCSILEKDLEEQEVQIEYKGFERFEQPKKKQFGINEEADLYVGDLVFEVSLA